MIAEKTIPTNRRISLSYYLNVFLSVIVVLVVLFASNIIFDATIIQLNVSCIIKGVNGETTSSAVRRASTTAAGAAGTASIASMNRFMAIVNGDDDPINDSSVDDNISDYLIKKMHSIDRSKIDEIPIGITTLNENAIGKIDSDDSWITDGGPNRAIDYGSHHKRLPNLNVLHNNNNRHQHQHQPRVGNISLHHQHHHHPSRHGRTPHLSTIFNYLNENERYTMISMLVMDDVHDVSSGDAGKHQGIITTAAAAAAAAAVSKNTTTTTETSPIIKVSPILSSIKRHHHHHHRNNSLGQQSANTHNNKNNIDYYGHGPYKSHNQLKSSIAFVEGLDTFLFNDGNLNGNHDELIDVPQELIAVNLPGDIILGGLFPVHEKGEMMACGHNVYNRGVQRLEAMLYAIDRINNDTSLLPNITLGVHILDTCSRDTYALNQSLQFVRSSINNLDASQFECSGGTTPTLRQSALTSGPLVGVIGGSYSSVSLSVANLLRLFHIPQISPASTAKALSDKTRFDLFARTVPPDNYQSAALADIVRMLNWTYVSSIYSEGSYGEYGIEQFHKEADERNVCIAVAEKIPSNADDRHFDNVITKLLKKPNARGVILFTRAEDARRVLMAAKRANLSNPFHWIASDGWGKQMKLVEGLEDIAEGAITVELQSAYIPEFDEYMFSKTPKNNLRNPWFEEFWEDQFGCKLAKNVPVVFNPVENDKLCNESLRLSNNLSYEQESKAQFVIDAVYAFAHALHNLYYDVCVNKQQPTTDHQEYSNATETGIIEMIRNISHNGVCQDMATYDGKDFYDNYLLNVSFFDIADTEVKFDRQGDALARYEILNFQQGNCSPGGFYYKKIGKWSNTRPLQDLSSALSLFVGAYEQLLGADNDSNLELNINDVIWNHGPELPTSACSAPCELGQIKKQQGDTCCWICDKCEHYEYVLDEFTCQECLPGTYPYADKSACYNLPVQIMRWDSSFAMVPLGVTGFGISVTTLVIWIFLRNHDTPLVRASGRELSYMLLIGILVCYCNTFPLLAKPTIISCVSQRLGIGVGFSIVYGALLTKTNRISRIFDSASTSALRPHLISPKSQVVISISFIGIQVLITLIWMVVEPPGVRYYYPDREQVILKCNIQDMSFLFSQMYNMILISICTVYAVKTRKIPENFNESKFIGFSMYTTCIIWLAFVPIYFSTQHSFEIQITTLSISISLSATVALFCLYMPKLYILVFHPDKNVRKLTMNISNAYRRADGEHFGALLNEHQFQLQTLPPEPKPDEILLVEGGDGIPTKIVARRSIQIQTENKDTQTTSCSHHDSSIDIVIHSYNSLEMPVETLTDVVQL